VSRMEVTPVPVPAEAGRVLLYGGLFDPPHRAHVELAALARDRWDERAWLVLVPAGRSPLKDREPAADEHRLAMVRLALRGIPWSEVWTDEIDRWRPGEASYWIDTLRRARGVLPEKAELRFLIGADQALDFHRWRGPREILALAEPMVLLREPAGSGAALREGLRRTRAWSDAEIEAWAARVVEAPGGGTSATAVRERLAAGAGDVAELDPGVLGYIRAHGLYAR
jgi:nicotinate-nucleotide adenylyltransferase